MWILQIVDHENWCSTTNDVITVHVQCMTNNDCALMLRALNGCENYFEMMKDLIVKLFLSITGSRVLGLCGQKTP